MSPPVALSDKRRSSGSTALVAGRVAGMVALVTGAGRGQGRSHALRLAQEGADIIAVDICAAVETAAYEMSTPADLKETRRLVEAVGRRAVCSEADIRDQSSLIEAVKHGVDELGRLDIVCANAGIVSTGSWSELSERSWQEMIDINLTGAWHTCRAAVPHLVAGGRGGSVILTSSTLGLKGMANVAHHASAKHGLVGLMRALAIELAPHRIRVNTIHPTSVNTPMIQNEQSYRLFRPDLDAPTVDDVRDSFAGLNLIDVPWVEAADISHAVLFLASEEARFITGATLPIDAGLLAK